MIFKTKEHVLRRQPKTARSGWGTQHKRFGAVSFKRVLGPALTLRRGRGGQAQREYRQRCKE
ncbi:MAG: hypothetical protein C0600_02740 [Ignavibacteria bacterium]|nr:MAG: hypothetical protein C0600_02740 [Ignavibacteria bacterium]